MKTPLTAHHLRQIISDLGWTQPQLAERTGIIQSTITRHLSGERDVRDEHLSAYVRALPEIDKPRLVAAWLRDVLTADDAEFVLDPQTGRLSSEVLAWLPALPPAQKDMLTWFAEQMVRVPDFGVMLEIFCRNAGYKAPGA